MADEKENKWDEVNALIKRTESSTALSTAQAKEQPLAVIDTKIEEIRQQKIGLLGTFKRGGIERRAALEKLQAMHQAQIEVTKHALVRAVDVEKERVDLIASKYMRQIGEEYLRDLQALGLQNVRARGETMLKLNETTAQLLRQANLQDVPQILRERTINSIMKNYEDFAAQLSADEIKLK